MSITGKIEKFNMIVPMRKAYTKTDENGQKHYYIQGYASSDQIDRDGDRMSLVALNSMVKQIMGSPMTLFVDHEHGLTDGIGVITLAKILSQEGMNLLWIEARLEDPEINSLTKLVLHKIDIGERIGFSIGGDMAGAHNEFNGGVSNRVIDGVKLYEISGVGLASNAESFATGSVFKSLRQKVDEGEIYSLFCKDGQCEVIFKNFKIKSQNEELLDMFFDVQKEIDHRSVKELTLDNEEKPCKNC
jgi:hypothetical protein